MKKYKFVDCISFDSDINFEKFNAILINDLNTKDIRIIKLKNDYKKNKNNNSNSNNIKMHCFKKDVKYKNNNTESVENNDFLFERLNILLNNLGISEYRFRKGVGYKASVQRLKFAKFTKNDKVVFYKMKKEGRRFTADENNILEIPKKELKYIYPLILSPEIKEDGLIWNHHYIIYPYEFGEKKPISEEKFKKEAPVLFNHLKAHKKELLNQSSYNARIQNNKEFYSLIRVGEYTYSKIYLVMRDNTKAVFQIVKHITTDWGEQKIPIFDNHISYLSRINNKEISEEEAIKIKEILSWKETKAIIEGMFDSRSISSRIPIKIERILNELSTINK